MFPSWVDLEQPLLQISDDCPVSLRKRFADDDGSSKIRYLSVLFLLMF